MTISHHVAGIRSRLLPTLFQLLYTRLGFLHEAIGRVAYGRAWNGRRRHVASNIGVGPLVDLGCGEGRLLETIAMTDIVALGIEPSPQMSRRARQRGVAVVQASAQQLPLRDASVRQVVATYPGPWILDARTWGEVSRICASGATVSLLLGGDITRGRGARVRRTLMRLAYGAGSNGAGQLPPLGDDGIVGDYVWLEDEWGIALLWRGTRAPTP